MSLINICNRIIEYCFYAIFLFVPLAFSSQTSELFELNKMWLTWGLTIVIGMCWFAKMILERRILFQRTPLDIPIILFLVSQIISTIFSLDSHVSLWGYYSRFNGGLLSILSYVFLYYAFLSNFQTNAVTIVKRLLLISLVSGTIVALWGLPSHFGYDPTCFLFRGTFDVSCWTADFMPTARIFSTLGQPVWLAAYLAILIPIAMAYSINNWNPPAGGGNWKLWILLSIIALFYVDLLYTYSRSGFLGIWISLIFFTTMYFWLNNRPKLSFSAKNLKSPLSILFFGFIIITFIIGTSINQLKIFTWEGLQGNFQKVQAPISLEKKPVQDPAPTQSPPQAPVAGGTESGEIRSYVWTGAINIWKNNPLIGTGVETFAYAYYKHKPVGQNLTSEWNFLYNKAHNEYLNYLATTGAFGLITYLAMIGSFLFITVKRISKSEFLISNQTPNPKSQLGQLEIRSIRNFVVALLAGYVSILITNFFGFSVVMTNIYLFMIPAFVFVLTKSDLVLTDLTKSKTVQNTTVKINDEASVWQWTPIFFVGLIGLFMLYMLFRFWLADISYALGSNLNKAGEYQMAYQKLHEAVTLRGDEPVFKDELSINNAIIATSLITQADSDPKTKDSTIATATSLAQEAINTSDEIISKYPNNAVFWKTRVRLFYTLSQVNSSYLQTALDAIIKASLLAPQDANIIYNLGILYGQNNNVVKGIEALEKTIILKPDYRDARYALGLFYRALATDEKGNFVKDERFNQKALDQMQYILKHLNPADPGALESVKNWGL